MAPVEVNNNTNANTEDKGNYLLERIDFTKGDKAGFHFFTVEYKDLGFATEKLGKGDKAAGEKIVLGLLNQQISLSLRNRAGARMPDVERPDGMADDVYEGNRLAKVQAEIAAGNTCLVTSDEAESYVPGTREKTSLISLQKELQVLLKNGQNKEALEILQIIEDLQNKQKAELLALVG